MRIFHINCNFLLRTALHQNLIIKLNEAGLDDTVYAPVSSLTYSCPIKVDNVIVSQCFKKWDRLFYHIKQNKIFADIKSKFDLKEFDCIHAYTLFTDGNNARRLSEEYGIPYIVTVRSTDIDVFFKYMKHLKGLGIKIMSGAEKVIFFSEAARETVFLKYVPKKYRKELSEKAVIIPNGIDDFWFNNLYTEKRTIDDKCVKLIFAGNLSKLKNITAIIPAMEELKKKGIFSSLTVVGKKLEDDVYKTIINAPDVHYHEAVPKEELISFYRSSDIFIMTSFIETFGLVYAEAMSQGLPVVYSKGVGFDTQFEEGVVGYHANPKDPADIANAIVAVIKNYNAISEQTTKRVQKFKWESIVSTYLRIYNDIVSRHASEEVGK